VATRRQQQQAAAAFARAADVERDRLQAEQRLQVVAGQGTRRARLVEQTLLDGAVEHAAAELRAADPNGPPVVAVVWVEDGPPGGALIGDRAVEGRKGELQLVAGVVAEVLKDAGYVEVREPLTLPAGQRPKVAAELREVAAALVEAADRLDPQPAKQQPAKRQATAKRRGV
jgi:hypothetical protein